MIHINLFGIQVTVILIEVNAHIPNICTALYIYIYSHKIKIFAYVMYIVKHYLQIFHQKKIILSSLISLLHYLLPVNCCEIKNTTVF